MLRTAFILTVLFTVSNAIKCHQCGGAENIPKFAKDALNKLNISADSIALHCGDAENAIGHVCLYDDVMGCATLREDNKGVPTDTCYDLGQVSNSNSTGYTANRVDCYCQKDFCNSAQKCSMALLAAIIIISIISSF
uniref:Protein sleepless n=1 Tax=Caenorhabditis japonica TaxID=281687 RepID=A0A8R1EVS9_CAEJA